MHDFSDAFDGDEILYIDGCHVNARGNEIIARRIDEAVGDGWAARAIRRSAGIDATLGPSVDTHLAAY
jgi:hypothetical protein